MKKFIALIAAVSFLAVPVAAEARGRDHYNNYNRHHHRDRGVSTGAAVAIGLGALILGGAIANSNRQRQQRYVDPRYDPYYQNQQLTYVCQNEYVRDYNGNYILDQYGRAMFNQRCWYQ